jgi:hypothetical protein
MATKEKVMEGKFIIYPFGRWWIAQDAESKRAIMKGTSRANLMEKLAQEGESK